MNRVESRSHLFARFRSRFLNPEYIKNIFHLLKADSVSMLCRKIGRYSQANRADVDPSVWCINMTSESSSYI